MGTHLKHLNKALLMSTHNMFFMENNYPRIITQYSSLISPLYLILYHSLECSRQQIDDTFLIFWKNISKCCLHWRLSKPSNTVYWKSPVSILGILEESNFNFRYVQLGDLNIPIEKWLNHVQTHWRPWSDVAFLGVWSGSALFANYLFRGLQTTIGWYPNTSSFLILYGESVMALDKRSIKTN